MDSNFSDRLKKAMTIRGMKQIDLSNKAHLDKSLISNYINGNYTAKQENIHAIALALNVDEGWLMGYNTTMDRKDDIETIHIDNARYIKTATQMIKIPILGKIPAGVPIEAIQDISGYEEIPVSMLKNDSNYFALKVEGDSMFPDYQEGDVLIVKQQNDCNSGDDCIVMVDSNDATFKRVIKQSNSLILKPLNNTYEPYVFTEYDIMKQPVKILGIVIESRRRKKHY